MSKTGIFMADGCEEIEGLTVVDILRRAGIKIDMIAVADSDKVKGSHGIAFECDKRLDDADLSEYDGIILPGGMPGTTNLGSEKRVVDTAKEFAANGKLVAAICAAPSILGDNGMLQGRKACCYPGMEDRLKGADVKYEPAVRDGNIITGRGMGCAIDFALMIVSYFTDDQKAGELGKSIVWKV